MLQYVYMKKYILFLGFGISICTIFFYGFARQHVFFDVPPPTTSSKFIEKPFKQEPVGIPITATFTLPILSLHHIGTPPASLSADAKTWYLSEQKFEELLKAISEWNLTPLTAHQVVQSLQSGYLTDRAILLTFDDGAIDFYTHAFPLLKKYNIHSTVFLQSHVRSKAWLSDEHIQELANSNLIEFGSHTKYNQYLTRVSEEVAKSELKESKQKIESIIGNDYIVSSLAYPFGLYNNKVKEWANEAGYDIAFTIDGGAIQLRDDPFAFTRIIITNTTNIEKLLAQYYSL